MAVSVFEDQVELTIPVFQEVAAPRQEPFDSPPHRRYERTGNTQRSLRALILENQYTRLAATNEFGGRVLSLFDKRSGVETLRPLNDNLEGGIEFCPAFGSNDARYSAGFATVVQDSEDRAAVAVGSTDWSCGLSYTAEISLGAESAAMNIELRVFNRHLWPEQVMPRITMFGNGASASGNVGCLPAKGTMLAAVVDARLAKPYATEQALVIGRALTPDGVHTLPPHRTDKLSARLTPLPECDGVSHASNRAVISIGESGLGLWVSKPRAGHAILLGLENGDTVEAPVDAYPEHPTRLTLDNLACKPVLAVVRDASKQEILRADLSAEWSENEPPLDEIPFVEPDISQDLQKLERRMRATDVQLLLAAFIVQHDPARAREHASEATKRRPAVLAARYYSGLAELALGDTALADGHLLAAIADGEYACPAWFALGLSAMRQRRWGLGAHDFEEALLFSGDDPLAWWLKHWCLRMADSENPDDLPNAHFLAPLEPALRADAFLQSPAELPGEGRLLATLGNDPQPFLAVAEILWLAGLTEELGRWLHEADVRAPNPMINLLLAAALLDAGKEMAAAEQVSLAQSRPGTPRVWRLFENLALGRLSAHFDKNDYLSDLIG
ncbi:MAG: hypothetical protein ACR2HJ_12965 [Fimbriimonadales bacterium]